MVAYLALSVALGGTAYAAAKIDGHDLVDRSVTAKKVEKDTLSGAEIKERTLGKVGSAGRADTTRQVRRIDFRGAETSFFGKTLMKAGPMRLIVGCTQNEVGTAFTSAQLKSTTGVGNAVATVGLPDTDGSPYRSDEHTFESGMAFGPDAKPLVFLPMGASGDDFEQGEAQVVYRDDARVVTFVLHGFVDLIGGKPYCELNGTATIA